MEKKKESVDFETQLAEFEARLRGEFDSRLEAVKSDAAEKEAQMRDQIRQLEAGQPHQQGNAPKIDVALLYDPFDVQNALAFKQVPVLDRHNEFTGLYETVIVPPDDEFPEGQVLGWKSPRFRADRGWQGWQPFLYGDAYTGENGELLTNYLVDPPIKGEGESDGDFDRHVRRKGMVLCRLDKRFADARDAKASLKGTQQVSPHTSGQDVPLAQHVRLTGEGLQDQKNMGPGDFRLGQKPPMGKNVLGRTELMPHNRH